ncbi:uncharacterized protein LOC143450501 [Clavelina lepadiformis]|uniref:uncharacterized protein LOC143450501 n=1 Tax=Clavelina lepadiformis TaxID=159417 RepID=UPI00404372B1
MKLRIPYELRFLAPFCLLTVLVVWNGIFDDSYNLKEAEAQAKKLPESAGTYWNVVLLFFAGTCFYRFIDAWQLARDRKITQVDLYFVTVLSGFALLQYASSYSLFNAFVNPEGNAILISRMTALKDWSVLPVFGWVVAWSRHVRRGWMPGLNWTVCIVASLSFFVCVIHRFSFYFLLGVGLTLSCIALYETYKVHFYRSQVGVLFYVLLFLHVFFFVTRLLDFVTDDFGWLWTYMFMTSFALIVALANKLYVRILIEVNEHKY